jgi:hypothetical protein
MVLSDGEPAGGPWRVCAIAAFARFVLNAAGDPRERPPIVALDGRSSSGKTTLARRLQAAVPDASTVHTDDIAWWHARFDWAPLLRSGVLEPLHNRRAVSFRPPAWDQRARTGAIEVASNAPLVIVEGVGAGRRETAGLINAIVWVQADLGAIERAQRAAGRGGRDDDRRRGQLDGRGIPLRR